MNKLKMKMTTMLLIAAFMISTIAFSVPLVSARTTWYVPDDFTTIQDAIDSPDVQDGDVIRVRPGYFAGALVTKKVIIVGSPYKTIIDSGPVHSSGLIQGFRLLAGSDGAVISHLCFEVDLVIMNAGAVDDVTISHNIILNAIQGISNWRGSGWKILHNKIIDLRTACGGGIGILVADYTGGVVKDNIVSYNIIKGTLHVDPDDCGGYEGSGIVLYADFRWGASGALEIKENYVTHNKVSLISDTPLLVDVVAFELTDTRDDLDADPYPVIFDNSAGFNDFRGTANQIAITPQDLENHNTISRNLGDNRGHGTVPAKVFNPVN